MNKIFFLFCLCIFLNSCGPVNLKTKDTGPFSNTVIDKVSQDTCPQNQSLVLLDNTAKLTVTTLPNPVIFGANKGVSKCSIDQPINEPGGTAWLTISFSDNCIENGSLWRISSFQNANGQAVQMSLARVDTNNGQTVQISTNAQRAWDSIAQKLGLSTFICGQPSAD